METSQDISITGRFLRVAKVREEWLTRITHPEGIIDSLRGRNGADLFTFWQLLPETEPRFDYSMEWDNVAALPVTTYEEWWRNRTNANVRRAVRKAKKEGLEVRVVPFSDDLVEGMQLIFNETPIRQGKRMRHYGKEAEELRKGYLPLLDISDFLAAYWEGEFVGFAMIVYTANYAYLPMIMSTVQHRDKYPNNALISKAVELCAEKRLPFLLYTKWYEQGVTEFKRRNGFEKIRVPRYYIPLTWKGWVAVRLNLQGGLRKALPTPVYRFARWLRGRLYELRYKFSADSPNGAHG